MKFSLMNLDHEAALIRFGQDFFNKDLCLKGDFIEDIEVIEREYLPFGAKQLPEGALIPGIERWMLSRTIPEHRDGAGGLNKMIGTNHLLSAVRMTHFSSLTDGYWLKGADEHIQWADVNYFRNKFSYDLGNIGLGLDITTPSLHTPDLTTNGQMKKTWRRKDKKLYLLKQGMYPDYEEPFNEKAATVILERFCRIPFVRYDIANINGHICSICENFLKEGQELVTAAELCATAPKPDFVPIRKHLKDRCKAFGIPGYNEFLDNMYLLDFIIDNRDRHLGNIGFIYDTEAQAFVGPAPIYDNGTSLWNIYVPKPPAETIEQAQALFLDEIRLKKPEKIDLGRLEGISDILCSLYAGSHVSQEKIVCISKMVENRIEAASIGIERLVEHHQKRDMDIER